MNVKPESNFPLWIKHLADVSVIWLLIIFYRLNPYYFNFLNQNTQFVLFCFALTTTFLGWINYYFRPQAESKVLTAALGLRRLAGEFRLYLSSFGKEKIIETPAWTPKEKVAILFMLVKIFFVPLMLNFAVINYLNLISHFQTLTLYDSSRPVEFFNQFLYGAGLEILFFIDTAFFCFGYLFEADFLDNEVRSVDPTWLGWFVALACYPPFNEVTGKFIPGYNSDYPLFVDNIWLTTGIRMMILILILIYAAASVALGPKASNLTNRGVVTYGPYAFVRHPAYITKNLAWFLGTLPVFGVYSILSSLGIGFVYFLRAITEERHLSQDPDYQAYCQKVKYRFIPGIY